MKDLKFIQLDSTDIDFVKHGYFNSLEDVIYGCLDYWKVFHKEDSLNINNYKVGEESGVTVFLYNEDLNHYGVAHICFVKLVNGGLVCYDIYGTDSNDKLIKISDDEFLILEDFPNMVDHVMKNN